MAQPRVVTVGPLATADPDGISLSQTAAIAAGQYLVLNGALCSPGSVDSFDADSICASQTPSGSGALTIDGALAITSQVAGAGMPPQGAAVAATVRFQSPKRVYITCAGNNSGRTFTIVGTLQSATTFGPGAVISETLTGANTNVVASTNLYSTIISVSINGASTGAVTVGHSGLGTLDKARRIIITSGGNDTGISFVLTGTDCAGNTISETITGASGAAASSVLSYLTVTSVKTSAAAASTLLVGTNGVADSPWVHFDNLSAMAPVAIQATVSGTVNFDVEQTLDDPNSTANPVAPASMTWLNHPDAALAGATATAQGNYAYPPAYARLTLNSGTGSVVGTFIQSYQG